MKNHVSGYHTSSIILIKDKGIVKSIVLKNFGLNNFGVTLILEKNISLVSENQSKYKSENKYYVKIKSLHV